MISAPAAQLTIGARQQQDSLSNTFPNLGALPTIRPHRTDFAPRARQHARCDRCGIRIRVHRKERQGTEDTSGCRCGKDDVAPYLQRMPG